LVYVSGPEEALLDVPKKRPFVSGRLLRDVRAFMLSASLPPVGEGRHIAGVMKLAEHRRVSVRRAARTDASSR
jgi:hypothetical protein